MELEVCKNLYWIRMRLTVEAVLEQSYEKLRRAMLTDPLVNSISDADKIIHELLELERKMIPDVWYKDRLQYS